MFVGHFAAGLALRGRAREVPTAAWIGGAFLLDGWWIALGVSGLDPTPWSDWSHSLLMAAVWATLFALPWSRLGRAAVVALWLAVMSHWLLDLIIQGSSLWPGQPLRQIILPPVTTHAWVVQRALTVALMTVFVADERRVRAPGWRTAAACAVVTATSLRR